MGFHGTRRGGGSLAFTLQHLMLLHGSYLLLKGRLPLFAMGAWPPTDGQTGGTAICRVHLSLSLRWTWALWKQTGDSFFLFQGPSPQPAWHHPGPRLQAISIRDIHSSHKGRLESPQICLDLGVPFLVRRAKGPLGQWPSDYL